jgi:ABC-type transport system substrate-binding protein
MNIIEKRIRKEKFVKQRKLFSFLGLLLIAALVLSACKTATEEPTDAPPPVVDEPFEPASVAAASCDYGGKIKEIRAVDQFTVEFTMCIPDPAFPAKAAFTPFGIQPEEWIAETGGTGEILEHPIGTGPFMLEEWARGDSVIFKRFDDYWGDAPPFETLVFRWATEGAARLLELQAGTVDQITNLSPDDFAVVQGDDSLTFIPIANPNVLYLAMTNTFTPFDDVNVRKAIAMGIDRQRIVDNFYAAGSLVPDFFTP